MSSLTMQKLMARRHVTPSGCWEWTGCVLKSGYGQVWDSETQKLLYVHVAMYVERRGAIPAGKNIDHRCNNKKCFRFSHLRAVSPRANTLRGGGPTAINARKKLCLRGHPFDYVDKRGRRVCRSCKRDKMRLIRAKGGSR